jgi:hypothetical protein
LKDFFLKLLFDGNFNADFCESIANSLWKAGVGVNLVGEDFNGFTEKVIWEFFKNLWFGKDVFVEYKRGYFR